MKAPIILLISVAFLGCSPTLDNQSALKLLHDSPTPEVSANIRLILNYENPRRAGYASKYAREQQRYEDAGILAVQWSQAGGEYYHAHLTSECRQWVKDSIAENKGASVIYTVAIATLPPGTAVLSVTHESGSDSAVIEHPVHFQPTPFWGYTTTTPKEIRGAVPKGLYPAKSTATLSENGEWVIDTTIVDIEHPIDTVSGPMFSKQAKK